MKIYTLTLLSIVIMLTTACHGPRTVRTTYPGSIPHNTELAINRDGSLLAVSWYDDNKKPHARLLAFDGTRLVSNQPLVLPPNKFTSAFGYEQDELLVTTFSKEGSSLIKVNVLTGKQQLLTHGPRMKRFPLEDKKGSYVFLEAGETIEDSHTWQRLVGATQYQINSFGFKMAAPLNVVGDSLFLMIPAIKYNMPIQSTPPSIIRSYTDEKTSLLQCSDTLPPVCVTGSLHFKPKSGGSYMALKIHNGEEKCTVPGEWIDLFGVQISKNGRFLIFHSAGQNWLGPRTLQMLDTQNSNCKTQEIFIKAD